MINLEELRLGNYVIDDGSPVKITRPFMVYLLERKANQLDPLPLSPDLLEKCGFKNNGQNEYFIDCWPGIDLRYRGSSEKYFKVFGVRDCLVQHLHQLQNLYHAITLEELPITL